MPSFAHQKKRGKVQNSKAGERGGLRKGIPIHACFASWGKSRAGYGMSLLLKFSAFLEPMHRCTDAPLHQASSSARRIIIE